MTITELKARFGELAIEKIKCENLLQNILLEQQQVLSQLSEAEKREAKKAASTKPVEPTQEEAQV